MIDNFIFYLNRLKNYLVNLKGAYEQHTNCQKFDNHKYHVACKRLTIYWLSRWFAAYFSHFLPLCTIFSNFWQFHSFFCQNRAQKLKGGVSCSKIGIGGLFGKFFFKQLIIVDKNFSLFINPNLLVKPAGKSYNISHWR
jgi:hypothetical protein